MVSPEQTVLFRSLYTVAGWTTRPDPTLLLYLRLTLKYFMETLREKTRVRRHGRNGAVVRGHLSKWGLLAPRPNNVMAKVIIPMGILKCSQQCKIIIYNVSHVIICQKIRQNYIPSLVLISQTFCRCVVMYHGQTRDREVVIYPCGGLVFSLLSA